MKKNKVLKLFSFIFVLLGIISVTVGIININKKTDDVKSLVIMEASNNIKFEMKDPITIGIEKVVEAGSEVKIEVPKEKKVTKTAPITLAHIKIPTYNQAVTGYILGCEGVSLYMALRGLGYLDDTTPINKFMDTMPKGNTPFEGYMGNPKIGHNGENTGKRTTIYPEPLTNWAKEYANAKDLTGATIEDLKKELDEGHVILAFVTSGWAKPIWKHYDWSINEKGEIENNHCLTIVGYRSNGDFLVNDCHDGRKDGRQGEYWISGEKFASIYNLRHYAISVY